MRELDSSLTELVIQEDPLAHAKSLYDQKLRQIGQLAEEAEIDDGYEKESFHAGFDRREKPEERKNLVNGVEASLFDFDALQDNLDFVDNEAVEREETEKKVSKKAKELINERKTIRQKV